MPIAVVITTPQVLISRPSSIDHDQQIACLPTIINIQPRGDANGAGVQKNGRTCTLHFSIKT